MSINKFLVGTRDTATDKSDTKEEQAKAKLQEVQTERYIETLKATIKARFAFEK